MLSYESARAKVIEIVRARMGRLQTESVNFANDPAIALGRVLAENISADRNYPPFNRSTRDGFALRSADAAHPGTKLRLIGESRAGVAFNGTVDPGTCVQIMTGAAVPRGADTVVMQEFARVEDNHVVLQNAAQTGRNFVLAGSESRVGEVVVSRGDRLGYPELAMAAQVGRAQLAVTRRPRVAILSTGDEVVAVEQAPGPFQIRNSNSVSLAAQVAMAGGEPVMLGSAPDEIGKLRALIEKGVEADMIVLTGGVSVGKYDLVEQVLREFGAEFFFDAIAIRPGKPAVFGWCHEKPAFGLPGNPVSTMVTFELLVVPAIELMSGHKPDPLPFYKAKLVHPIELKSALTHFLPARVTWPSGEPSVALLPWEGSGDVGAVVRGNCYLVVHESNLKLAAGDWVDVLPRRGIF
ncbi:MAG TPA: gephyrin-like molybdotransferase Glp [Candidatus Acidoferrales bacterium]|nr:gephyrin-like molybdotransferase Glp [Candidatus Acidoferrales bacterium]